MIYRLLVLSAEADVFFREIEINSESTFLDLQNVIFDSVGYTKNEMTSFFICEHNWEKRQEITLIDMGTNSDEDSYLMEETQLEEFDLDEGDRLLLTYDMLADRSFFIEVKEQKSGYLADPLCTLSKGDAPVQLMNADELLFADTNVGVGSDDLGDFYGDSEYDLDELSEDGFGGFSSIDDLDERYI